MRSLEDLAERLEDGYTRLFTRLTGTPIEERGLVEVSSGEEIEYAGSRMIRRSLVRTSRLPTLLF